MCGKIGIEIKGILTQKIKDWIKKELYSAESRVVKVTENKEIQAKALNKYKEIFERKVFPFKKIQVREH